MVFAVGVRAVPARTSTSTARRARHWQDVLRVRRCRRSSPSPPIEDVAVYRTTVQGAAALARGPGAAGVRPGHDRARSARCSTASARSRCGSTTLAATRLPADQPLRATLGNLIRSQLSADAPAADRLLPGGRRTRRRRPHAHRRPATVLILGQPVESFDALMTGTGLCRPTGPRASALAGWAAYVVGRPRAEYTGRLRARRDRRSTRSTTSRPTTCSPRSCETFLAGYARVVDEARAAVRGELRAGRPRAALRAVPGVPAAVRVRPRRGEHAHRQAPRLLLPPGAAAAEAPGRAEPGPRAGRAGQARRRAPARRGHAAQGRQGRHRRRRPLRRRPRPRRQQGASSPS